MPPKRLRGKGPNSSGSAPRQVTQPNIQTAEQVENEAALALQQELAWCLERLETQMKAKNTNQKQMEEASRAWRNLQSTRTPLVKKRQIMRGLFGDYRTTMEKEACQFAIKPQNMSLTPVSTARAPKSKYFKSSSFCPQNIMDSTTKEFEFGFSLADNEQSTTNGSSNGNPSHTEGDTVALSSLVMQEDNSKTGEGCVEVNNSKPVSMLADVHENYYLMSNTKSKDAGFTFDFSVAE